MHYSHFFSKKFQHICVSLDVNFNESLTNDVVSFQQLGPDNQRLREVKEAIRISQFPHAMNRDQEAYNLNTFTGLCLPLETSLVVSSPSSVIS